MSREKNLERNILCLRVYVVDLLNIMGFLFKRDRLRCGVDEILGEFKPAVRYDKYQVKSIYSLWTVPIQGHK